LTSYTLLNCQSRSILLRALPTVSIDRMWGVYCLWFTKPNHIPKLYCGSGTDEIQGVQSRIKAYTPNGKNLPSHVKRAFENGYTLSHAGLVYWTSLPEDGDTARLRSRLLLLEGYFTIIFNACFAMASDIYLSNIELWPRKSASWQPLCSHSPV